MARGFNSYKASETAGNDQSATPLNSKEATKQLEAWLAKMKMEDKTNLIGEKPPAFVGEIIDNLDQFVKASKGDMAQALEKATSRSFGQTPQVIELMRKYNAKEVTLSNAVKEYVKIGDTYEYYKNLKDIRANRADLAKTVKRMLGQMRQISKNDGRRENTAAEREYRNAERQ